LVVYAVIGAIAVLAGLIVAWVVPYLIDIPPSLDTPARIAAFLLVLAAAIEFPLGLFGDLLVAQQRYDVTNLAGMASIFAYLALIVGLIPKTGGIVLVAAIVFATRLIRLGMPMAWVRRELPFLRFERRHVTRAKLRELTRFSADNFLIHMAG